MVTLKYGMIPLKLPLTPVVFELFHVYMSIPFVTNGGLLRIALRKNILSLMENGSFST